MTTSLRHAAAIGLCSPLLMATDWQEVVPMPEVGYSADQVIEAGGQSINAKVHYMPGVQRQDIVIEGMNTHAIIEYDNERVLTWSDQMPMLVELDMSDAAGTGLVGEEFASLTVTPAGQEEVNGIAATRHEVTGQMTGGGSIDGDIWLTPENIMVRLEGTSDDPNTGGGSLFMELSNLQIGAQDPSLFQPPADMPAMDMGEMMQGLQDMMQGMGQ